MNGFTFFNYPMLGLFFIPLTIWSLFWKGYALWTAAKKDSKPWFVALLIINTMGILEILYIYIFSKDKEQSPAPKTSKKISKKK